MKQIVNLDSLKEQAAKVVALAVARGATTAKASTRQQTEFEMEIRNGEVENLFEAESFSVTITLSRDHRRATVGSNDLSDTSLSELVDRALELCRYTDPDPFYSLPEKELLADKVVDLDLCDERLPSLTIGEKIALVKGLEDCLKAKSNLVKSDGASLSTYYGGSALANSLGFCEASSSTLVDLGIAGFAEDAVPEGEANTGRKQNSGWYSSGHFLETLESIEEIADQAIYRVARKIGARKPPTGHFPVYFEPGLARGLWGHLSSAVKGSNIYRNESYLEDKLGELVCHPNISISDDPWITRGLGSRCFDKEGVACKPFEIVKNGRLQSYMLNTYAANKLNLRSTGHAGGYANLVVTPGTYSEEEMIKHLGRGIWLTSAFGQGVKINTGEYARAAQGIWVEDGEAAYPISEFTLNSNLLEMLQNITMLGNNVSPRSSILAPGMVIGEMSVAGQ